MKIQNHQRGFVLVVGLLMLLVITIVGVTAMSGTSSNERMTANNQFQTISFQAAESAIHDVFNIPAVSPSVMTYMDPLNPGAALIPTPNNYDVNIGSGTVVGVTANSSVQFCGEELPIGAGFCNGIAGQCTLNQLFDVRGSGAVAALGTQEQHLRRGARLMINTGTDFDVVRCFLVQQP